MLNENKWHQETCEGFDIKLTWDYEDIKLESIFPEETPEQIAETYRKLDNYEYIYFVAIVRAYKNGIELACESLGGNLYEYNKMDSFLTDGYYKDMKAEVIAQAKQAIQSLITNP